MPISRPNTAAVRGSIKAVWVVAVREQHRGAPVPGFQVLCAGATLGRMCACFPAVLFWRHQGCGRTHPWPADATHLCSHCVAEV